MLEFSKGTYYVLPAERGFLNDFETFFIFLIKLGFVGSVDHVRLLQEKRMFRPKTVNFHIHTFSFYNRVVLFLTEVSNRF